ncbi:MAG TPA: class I SAM-dependent methyltransferase [Chloroflexota bacterium]|nr:class I SAM-dependent methyltransferase [Chloroflexota bacterium]
MRPCDACGSRSVRPLLVNRLHSYQLDGQAAEWRYNLLACEDCGLAFVDPEPGWELIQTFYGDDYGPYDAQLGPPEKEAYSFKYRIARKRYRPAGKSGPGAVLDRATAEAVELGTGKRVSFSLGLPLQLPKDAHIFELGYGSGNWLLAMAELGYRNLYGYDIDANPNSEHRLRQAGVTVWHGEFLKETYPAGFLDCIRLEHAFEHLLDPIAVLKKCRSMLKPGGWLVMNFPARGSWSEVVSLEDHPTLDLPRHLYRHTPESTRLILIASGFSPVAIEPYPVAAHLTMVVNAWRERSGRRPIPLRVGDVMAPGYALFSRLTGRGEHITAWATA